ncbi:hypothetical protein FRC17_003890 [Serendipita sp. 399]|nr:hypothetical protein FRC17_003890 [Serendipita sp. 399]
MRAAILAAKQLFNQSDTPRSDTIQDQVPIEQLRIQYQRQKQALEKEQRLLQRLKEENSHLEKQKMDQEKRIHEAQKQLDAIKQTTVDTPTEGTMSRDQAAQEFYSLTRNVFIVVRDIFHTLHPHLPKESITDKDVLGRVAPQFMEVLNDEEAPFLIKRLPVPCPILMLLIPIVHRALFLAILDGVFIPFVPGGLEQTTETLLSTMYTHLEKTEPQDRRSRWRALTYRHISQDAPTEIWVPCAEKFMQQLQAIYQSCTDHHALPEEDLLRAKVTTLFEQAVSLRDRSMKGCTDFDVSVVLPNHGPFRGYMKPVLPLNKNRPQAALFALSWVVQFTASRGIGQEARYFNVIWALTITEISRLPCTVQDLDKLAA